MCTIKFENSESKKSGFRTPEVKVADFPRGRWCWARAQAQDGDCHMSEDKEDGRGKGEASNAILPLNRGKQQKRGAFSVCLFVFVWFS